MVQNTESIDNFREFFFFRFFKHKCRHNYISCNFENILVFLIRSDDDEELFYHVHNFVLYGIPNQTVPQKDLLGGKGEGGLTTTLNTPTLGEFDLQGLHHLIFRQFQHLAQYLGCGMRMAGCLMGG
jgi:hypothetical protein